MPHGADGDHLGCADSLPQMDLRLWLGEGAAAKDFGLLWVQGFEGDILRTRARGHAGGAGEDGGGFGGNFGVRGVVWRPVPTCNFEGALRKELPSFIWRVHGRLDHYHQQCLLGYRHT